MAGAFSRLGHEVRVVTETAGDGTDAHAFPVIRKPGAFALWSCYRWADVVWHNNFSTRLFWPRFLSKAPCFVTTQTWLSGTFNKETAASRLKRLFLKCCRNISISHAIAEHIQTPSTVLGNPYDSELYRVDESVPRELKLVFVGRLVSDKGLMLLLNALVQLRARELHPALTVVGSGPERAACEKFVNESGLEQQVRFLGAMRGRPLMEVFNAHEILVIPSLWAEPFGVVALEGIACGCVVLGTKDGGLSEAIGPCGIVCDNKSVDALTDSLQLLLTKPDLRKSLRDHASSHLQQFSLDHIASKYLGLFR
jgi:glycogen synthase